MYITSKGRVRQIMTEGTIEIGEIKRISTGKIETAKGEPSYFIRFMRIETEEGMIELLLDAPKEPNLTIQSEPVSIFRTLKKQVTG